MDIEDRRLLRSQKNEVLDVLVALGMEPREFTWADRTEGAYNINRLVHSPSGFWFEFGVGNRGGHAARYSPGEHILEATMGTGSWLAQMSEFAQWVRFMQRELAAPPLWEQLAAGEPMLDVTALGMGDKPFDPAEIAAINQKLDETLEYLRRELPAGSIPAVEANIERLREAVKTSGRVSWAQMTIGSLIGMVWSGIMDPEKARTALQIIGTAFQGLIGAGG
jgi:hypothetical protein